MAQNTSTTPTSTKRESILVVDDDISMRFLVREALESLDVTVKEVDNGTDAIAEFNNHHPDLILLDIKMSGMDGFEVCKTIRRLPEGKNLPIVMMTGLHDVASVEHAFDIGATDFITKPIEWALFNHRIRYILKASEAFRNIKAEQRSLAEAQRIAKLGNWKWDLTKSLFFGSEECWKIIGVNKNNFDINTADTLLALLHPDDKNRVISIIENALRKQIPFLIEHRIIRPDKTERYISLQGELVSNKNKIPICLIGTAQDITSKKKADATIHQLAYYDALTGLSNRELYKENALKALQTARHFGKKVALLYLDLDNFKRINDTLGYAAGDKLLQKISTSLQECIRASDIILNIDSKKQEQVAASISRIGGDEFTILLTSLENTNDAGKIAYRLLSHLNKPIKVENNEFYVTGSIGIAIYPEDAEDVETLLKHADTAMFHAKKKGKNNVQFYAERMNLMTIERLEIEAKLKKAFDNNEFEVFYQPQIDIQTEQIVGVEALVRWVQPESGIIQPEQFITAAEDTGLIGPIGEWVLNRACQQGAYWQNKGLSNLQIGVNVSAHQFKQQNLVYLVQKALSDSKFTPKNLNLELTESLIMDDVEENISTLQKLKQLGTSISIDDFGTGYSSMNYLKRFPLDILKIDRNFISDIKSDMNSREITTAIIVLAKSLGLTTIAEGVETKDQLSFLRAQNCNQAQGYYFSPPLSPDKVIKFIKNFRSQNN